MAESGRWALIVHGGAKTIAPDRLEANRQGCRLASRIGAAILRRGGTALAAAEAAVRQLEDDATFNAGTGSVRNREGEIEMDAAIMDGATLDIGAVAALRRVRNPVSVAAGLLGELPVLLVGDGAERFARQQGFAPYAPDDPSPISAAAPTLPEHDTVGCVALDRAGHVAVATSTGGLTGQFAGRVGDAPLPGCGFYAADRRGGVAFSGDGESIMRMTLASRVMTSLETRSAQRAAEMAIESLARVGGEAGAIVIDREGRLGAAHSSDHFALGLDASWLAGPRVATHSDEIRDALA